MKLHLLRATKKLILSASVQWTTKKGQQGRYPHTDATGLDSNKKGRQARINAKKIQFIPDIHAQNNGAEIAKNN